MRMGTNASYWRTYLCLKFYALHRFKKIYRRIRRYSHMHHIARGLFLRGSVLFKEAIGRIEVEALSIGANSRN